MNSDHRIAKALNDCDNANISAPPAKIDATEGGNVNAGEIVHDDESEKNETRIAKIGNTDQVLEHEI